MRVLDRNSDDKRAMSLSLRGIGWRRKIREVIRKLCRNKLVSFSKKIVAFLTIRY